jgi:hypothetical protein
VQTRAPDHGRQRPAGSVSAARLEDDNPALTIPMAPAVAANTNTVVIFKMLLS